MADAIKSAVLYLQKNPKTKHHITNLAAALSWQQSHDTHELEYGHPPAWSVPLPPYAPSPNLILVSLPANPLSDRNSGLGKAHCPVYKHSHFIQQVHSFHRSRSDCLKMFILKALTEDWAISGRRCAECSLFHTDWGSEMWTLLFTGNKRGDYVKTAWPVATSYSQHLSFVEVRRNISVVIWALFSPLVMLTHNRKHRPAALSQPTMSGILLTCCNVLTFLLHLHLAKEKSIYHKL